MLTDRILGIGGGGMVALAIAHRTKRQLACKIIDLRPGQDETQPEHLRAISTRMNLKRFPSNVQKRFREFETLKDLSHVGPAYSMCHWRY